MIVTLVTLASVASPASGTSTGVDPGELADVILIFRPHEDHLFSVVDQIVRGDILRIERGLAPRLIVTPAGTLGPAWRAGVPIRLYLLAFTDRSAHYPIGAFPAPVPKPPEIAVSASNGLAIIHAAPAGAGISLDALLTVPDAESTVRVDVYAGLIPPSGEPLSLVVGRDPWPSPVASTPPVPLVADVVPTQSATFKVFHSFAASDPRGWYTFYGLVVPAGADPLDPHRWINASFFPFLVTP